MPKNKLNQNTDTEERIAGSEEGLRLYYEQKYAIQYIQTLPFFMIPIIQDLLLYCFGYAETKEEISITFLFVLSYFFITLITFNLLFNKLFAHLKNSSNDDLMKFLRIDFKNPMLKVKEIESQLFKFESTSSYKILYLFYPMAIFFCIQSF